MAEAQRARRDHLNAASQSLAFSSPAVSAYLYLQMVNDHDFDISKPNAQTKACSACGNMMVLGLGWSCRRITKDRSKRTRQDRLSESRRPATTGLECLKCSSISITTEVGESLRRPKNATIKRGGTPPQELPAAQPLRVPGSAPATAEAPTALDAGGKKRGRGKKSSLQAMLADRKTTGSSSGFGLSMDDFTK